MTISRVFGPQHLKGNSESWTTSCLGLEILGDTTDYLILFVRVDDVGGASPTLTAKLRDTPDGVNFVDVETLLDGAVISSPVLLRASNSKRFGSMGVVEISLGASDDEATVTAWIDTKPNTSARVPRAAPLRG